MKFTRSQDDVKSQASESISGKSVQLADDLDENQSEIGQSSIVKPSETEVVPQHTEEPIETRQSKNVLSEGMKSELAKNEASMKPERTSYAAENTISQGKASKDLKRTNLAKKTSVAKQTNAKSSSRNVVSPKSSEAKAVGKKETVLNASIVLSYRL